MRSVVVGIVRVDALVCPHLDADLRSTTDKRIVHSLNNREQLDEFRPPNNIDHPSDEFVLRTVHSEEDIAHGKKRTLSLSGIFSAYDSSTCKSSKRGDLLEKPKSLSVKLVDRYIFSWHRREIDVTLDSYRSLLVIWFVTYYYTHVTGACRCFS